MLFSALGKVSSNIVVADDDDDVGYSKAIFRHSLVADEVEEK